MVSEVIPAAGRAARRPGRTAAACVAALLALCAPAGAASVVVSHDASGNLTNIVSAVAGPPSIISGPLNVLAAPGGFASLSVNASSAIPVTYQWRRNGVDIAGATNDTLWFNAANVTHEGAYTVVVSNALGSAVSPAATFAIDIREVVAWGANGSGQTNVPPWLEHVIAVAGGGNHSMALLGSGQVVAWGYNGWGQTNVPVSATGAVAIAAGESHSLALLNNGSVVAWGYNNWGQTNVPAGLGNVVAISAGYWFSIALKDDGTLQGWGHNASGQTTIPTNIQGRVVGVAAGDAHTLALLADGTVRVWGSNAFGQTNLPGGFINAGIVAIAAKGNHSLAMSADGTITGWGDNSYGELTTPGGVAGVEASAIGYSHSMALTTNGDVVCWGANGSGQSTVPPLDPARAVACGGYHSLALARLDSAVAGPVFMNPPRALAGFGSPVAFRALVKNIPSFYGASGLPAGLAMDPATGVVGGSPLALGAFPVMLTATNAFGAASNLVTLTVLNHDGLTAIEIWRFTNFGTIADAGPAADEADPDADGIVNWVEFATASDPTDPSTMTGRVIRSGGVLEFTYTRSKAAMVDGVSYTVQWSDDLTPLSWSSAGVTESVVSEDSVMQVVKSLVPIGGGPRRFVRLYIVWP